MRVCSTPGCPELVDTGRCKTHAREYDRARGTRQERGYGREHDALRRRWARLVATGTVHCARCGERIEADQAWDLGHHDQDRSRYSGPECVPCNRATAGRTSHLR